MSAVLEGPETSNRLVGMACCQCPAATSPARLSAMVEAASRAIWQGAPGIGCAARRHLAATPGCRYRRWPRAVGDARLTNVKQIVFPARELARRGQHRAPGTGDRDRRLPAAPWPQARCVIASPSSQTARSGKICLLDGEDLGVAGADPATKRSRRAAILPAPGLPSMGSVGRGWRRRAGDLIWPLCSTSQDSFFFWRSRACRLWGRVWGLRGTGSRSPDALASAP